MSTIISEKPCGCVVEAEQGEVMAKVQARLCTYHEQARTMPVMTVELLEHLPCGCVKMKINGRWSIYRDSCGEPEHKSRARVGDQPPTPAPLAISRTLPYPPSGNLYKHHYCTKKVNKNGAHIVSAYYPPQTKAYLDKAKREADDAMCVMGLEGHPLTGPVVLTMVAFRPRKVGDLDNLLKITQDALEGIVYANDRQIVSILATRKEDKHNPRVEVIVSEAVP